MNVFFFFKNIEAIFMNPLVSPVGGFLGYLIQSIREQFQ